MCCEEVRTVETCVRGLIDLHVSCQDFSDASRLARRISDDLPNSLAIFSDTHTTQRAMLGSLSQPADQLSLT